MKKVLFLFSVLTLLSCSKDDLKIEPVTIIDSDWVNGHEEIIPENMVSNQYPDDTVGWGYEMTVTLRNNTNKEIKGIVFFYMNEWRVGTIKIDSLLENETKKFTQKEWRLGKGSYGTAYNDIFFEQL